ncbi:MAG: hypothetical protein ACFFC7_24025 [Candidatus Hermodarchaeota archaeon]
MAKQERRHLIVALSFLETKRSFDLGSKKGQVYILIEGVKWPQLGHLSMGAGDRIAFKNRRVLYEGITTNEARLTIDIAVKEHDRLTPDDTFIRHAEQYIVGTYSSNKKQELILENQNIRLKLEIWDQPTKF